QIPATSIFIKAASSGISGMGYSRISVLLGPTRTAARTLSATETPPLINAARNLGLGLDRSSSFSCKHAQARSRGWTAMATDAFDAAESEAGGSMPDGSAEVIEHVALLSQASRTLESPRAGEAMDACARFKLAQDAPILVGEIACGLPGCPPLETVV